MPPPYTTFVAQSQPFDAEVGGTVQSIFGVAFSTLGNNFTGPPIWPSMTFESEAVVGIPYSQQFDLAPAASPTVVTLQSGSLPDGLSVSYVSGDVSLLSGTPTRADTFNFTLRATNSYGFADKMFSVTIIAAPSGGNWGFVN